MKKQFFTLLALLLLFALPFSAQEIEVNGSRKAVRTSGDIGAVLYRRHHLRLEISGKKRPSRPQ